MGFIDVFVYALTLALDAFSVAITSGIILKKPTLKNSAKVGLFFGGFQFIMPCLGYFLCCFFADLIKSYDHWVAFILLGFIGGKMIWEAVSEKEDDENEIKNPLDNKLLVMMAIATSIDALAIGVIFATLGMGVITVTACSLSLLVSSGIIGVVAFILSTLGVHIGAKFGNLFGNKAEIVGGLVLICMGIKILIEHIFI